MLILYLDPYHLGDPLFLTQLARDLAHRGGGLLLVHTSGEAGERALEARGAVVTRTGGVLVTATDDEAAVVERAARELNRQIVHELNEAGVAAVRVVGADRGLLKRVDGEVVAGSGDWLRSLLDQGVVAVLATLVADASGPLRELDPEAALQALASTLGARVRVIERPPSAGREHEGLSLVDRLSGAGIDAEWVSNRELRSV